MLTNQMNNLTTIDYLKTGNEKQQAAFSSTLTFKTATRIYAVIGRIKNRFIQTILPN